MCFITVFRIPHLCKVLKPFTNEVECKSKYNHPGVDVPNYHSKFMILHRIFFLQLQHFGIISFAWQQELLVSHIFPHSVVVCLAQGNPLKDTRIGNQTWLGNLRTGEVDMLGPVIELDCGFVQQTM